VIPIQLKHGLFQLLVALSFSMQCQAKQSLELDVTTARTDIAVNEAVPVTVVFTNGGEKPFNLYPYMFTEGRCGSVEVTAPDRSVMTVVRPQFEAVISNYGSRPSKMLAPGESHTVAFVLCVDWNSTERQIFENTGQYKVRVRYADGLTDADVTSDPVEIRVVRPPTSERDALQLVSELPHIGALYDYGANWDKPEVVDKLRAIAAVEESQIYANYARLTLATWHLNRAQRAASEATFNRKEEMAAAGSYLERIRNEKFTLLANVQSLRQQLETMKAGESGRVNGNSNSGGE
jgi:hypothetical protein